MHFIDLHPDRCDWLLATNVPHTVGLELLPAASLCLPCPLAGAPSLLNQASTAGSTWPPGSLHYTELYVCISLCTYKKTHLTCILSFAFRQRNWCNRHPKRKVKRDARLLCIVFGGSCFRTAAFPPTFSEQSEFHTGWITCHFCVFLVCVPWGKSI